MVVGVIVLLTAFSFELDDALPDVDQGLPVLSDPCDPAEVGSRGLGHCPASGDNCSSWY